MAYLNKVMLIGNLGRDCEIRLAQSNGRKIANLVLATSRKYKDSNGEQKEQTYWHTLVAYNKTAEILEKLKPTKGTTMYVEGTLTTQSYEKDGQKQYSTKVVIDSFQLLTQRQNAQQGNQNSDANVYGNPSYDDEPWA